MELRDDQQETIAKLDELLERGSRRIIIQAPCGFGKTILAANLLHRELEQAKRTLFVVPVIALIDQTIASLNALGIDDIGVIQAYNERSNWDMPIQIASVQTLQRRTIPPSQFVIIDECFAAGTPISTPCGEIPIEHIRVGDVVYNTTGSGFVEAVSRRKKKLIRINLSSGAALRVTGNHPIFTEEGWVDAENLAVGSRLFSRKAMRSLWGRVPAMDVKGDARQSTDGGRLEKAKVLQWLLRQESREPDVEPRYSSQSSQSQQRAASSGSWRQWERIYEAAMRDSQSAGGWMASGTGGQDRNAKGQGRLSGILQDRHREPRDENWDRGGWKLPLWTEEDNRQEEDGLLGDIRVESISREELGRDEDVFNLSVTGHPSYYANGVLVHNCHKWWSFYEKWLLNEEWKDTPIIGLSATPWTKGLGAYFSNLLIAGTTQGMIDKGRLSDFKVYAPHSPDLRGVRTVGGDYHEADLSKVMNKAVLVADIVETWQRLGHGRSTLCFGVDRAHAKHIQQAFIAAGVPCGYQDAYTKDDERRAIKAKFHAGDYKVVCNVGTLCLDQETEILTSSGWVGMNAMSYDHRVAAWSESGIEFTHPLHIVCRDREPNEKMVSLEGRVHNIRVTSNHRMLWSQSPYNFKIKTAADIVGLSGFIPVSGVSPPREFKHKEYTRADEDRERKRRDNLRYLYRTKGATALQAIELEKEHREHLLAHCSAKMPYELSLDECKFIGFWIGDGTRSGGRFALTQSMRYPKIISWLDGLLDRVGLHFTRNIYPPAAKSSHHNVRWSLSSGRGGHKQRVTGGVAPYDEYLDKNGSELLWGMNKEQIEAVLYGYWMADGNHGDGDGEGRGKSISGANIQLFDLLQAVAACREIRISIRRDKSKHRKTPFWRMCWLAQSASRLVRERFKIEEDYRLERVWCVTSTTGNIITRRRGKVAVVGNTTGVDWDVRCIILARPTKSEMLFVQIVGRGLRTAEGKDYCLLLDHSDNHTRLGFVTDIIHDKLHDGTKAVSLNAEKINLPKKCPKCSYLKPPKTPVCPACGFKSEARPKIEILDGDLIEIKRHNKEIEQARINKMWQNRRLIYGQLLTLARLRGKKDGWAYFMFKDIFKESPQWAWNGDPPVTPDPAVINWVTRQNIIRARTRA